MSAARNTWVALLAVALLGAAATTARAAGESEEELAKTTQNPVADLISVPFQNNFNSGTGLEDRPNDTADWQLRFQLQFLFPK